MGALAFEAIYCRLSKGGRGRTEEHGAHVGHACEQVDTPVLEHDGGCAVVDGEGN